MPPELRCSQAAAHCISHARLSRCIVAVYESNISTSVACAAGRKAKLNVVPLEELMKQNEELGQMFGWCALRCCA
jgi:hypothetical protein